jgi:hypothetical protein
MSADKNPNDSTETLVSPSTDETDPAEEAEVAVSQENDAVDNVRQLMPTH